ncbi:MAG: TIGR00725 family protein [Solirubrobacterales bacterium]|nr:TIGR00725 family protein [Solirubrobacterales bacterium]
MSPLAPPYVAVVGPGEATKAEIETAEAVGRGLAQAGAAVITGGLGGVMAAACRGASGAGGLTIGILPGGDRRAANEWASVTIPTGLGELRNGLVVRAADAVIAVGGAYGTLSEVALALKTGVPVIGLGTWGIEGIEAVDSPVSAVARALEAAASARAS